MELVLQVSRDQDNRLNGSVRASTESSTHAFSGTLELMRVFELLVPAHTAEGDAGDRPPHGEETA